MPATHPADGESFQPGRIYIAPPNQHLQLEDGRINLVIGPREHGFRPAIDRLFRSAAVAHGERVVGVILSGTLYDGAAGMQAIHRSGGLTIVQDPGEAIFPFLPLSVIERDHADLVLPLSEIAHKINELAREPDTHGGEQMQVKGETEGEEDTALEGSESIREDVRSFENGVESPLRSILSCPDCGGVLWELRNGNLLRYECQIGHVYNEDSLLRDQINMLEYALWSAVRVLEQRAALTARLAVFAEQKGHQHSAGRFKRSSEDAERNADIIRQLIQREELINPPLPETGDEGQSGDVSMGGVS
jgi:two-component system chemotaxis response regulator CheB